MTYTKESNNGAGKTKSVLIAICLALISLSSAYIFSEYNYPRNIFPMDVTITLKNKSDPSAALSQGQYDNFGRLIAINEKKEVACPAPRLDTGVVLAIGQSNVANHAEKKIVTRFPSQVLNYYDGKCYIAASPLLGATGEEGEFITLLADKLIENGTYKAIIVISSGIRDTSIARWRAGGDLNQMLLDTLVPIKKYKVTDIVWHQGESDSIINTSAQDYEKSFYSLKDSLRDVAITAPFFIAVATKCGNSSAWKASNSTALAQKKLEDRAQIIVAVNTDELLESADRQADSCHLSETGQLKTAAAYAEAVHKYHNPH